VGAALGGKGQEEVMGYSDFDDDDMRDPREGEWEDDGREIKENDFHFDDDLIEEEENNE